MIVIIMTGPSGNKSKVKVNLIESPNQGYSDPTYISIEIIHKVSLKY